MSKTKTYSLYLIKKDVKKFEDVFSETAEERIKVGDVILSESSELGEKATVFVFENQPKPPNWLSDITNVFNGIPLIKNKSSSAVIVFSQSDRIFVTTFAHGWQFIDDTKI